VKSEKKRRARNNDEIEDRDIFILYKGGI